MADRLVPDSDHIALTRLVTELDGRASAVSPSRGLTAVERREDELRLLEHGRRGRVTVR